MPHYALPFGELLRIMTPIFPSMSKFGLAKKNSWTNTT
jgi:hypothetical protein